MQPAVSVLIDGSSNDLQFDYIVPEALHGKLLPGCRVRVPLRNRGATGTVTRVHDFDADGARFQLKPVTALIDPEPILTPPLLELARWMSEYYLASQESVFRAMIPQAIRTGEGSEKTRKVVRLKANPDEAALEKLRKRASRQADLVEHLRGQADQQDSLGRLTGSLRFGRPSITALEKAGIVEVLSESVERDPFGGEAFVPSQPFELNPEQRRAFERIVAACKRDDSRAARPLLLHGVTGSGKTEVYLQAIQHILDQGKGAIVLVPEISLTPQTAGRFKQRFADIQDEVAILHSHLSQGERHDEWRKVLRRKARIVIGARSAIFAPIANLGLIIVDEEHENSYKQDTVPRYQARDLAVVRGGIENCAVVLGSATPSLESFRNTSTGKYQLARLTRRVDDLKMPLIRVVDMRIEARRQRGGPAILSTPLQKAIEQRLEENEQVILFLNRRGFARSLLCPECGHVATCRHCSLALTYHHGEERLMCHLCGYAQVAPRRCPECRGTAISLAGFGTERVEKTLRKFFRTARIARIDSDAMRRKNQLRDTLNAFKAKKIDLLIGTQMIAKGLHFPEVTLVGILNADIGLHIPDFRAGERTFQLLTQVAGRAGRGERGGEVVVQTFTPHAPAIQFSRHHDFPGFAEQEFEMRRSFRFPPFVHLTMITARSVNAELAEFSLKTLHNRLKKELPDDVTLADPLPSPLEKSHDQWRFQLSLKSIRARRMNGFIRTVLGGMTFPEEVIVTVDVDPYNLS